MHLSNYVRCPPRYVLASMLCSLGGFLFGMDTGIIGSVTVMESYVSSFGPQSATVHGLIVSAILIPAATSSLFAGRVADILGRPKNIAIGALMFGLGAALEAGAIKIAMFVIGRVIEGIGEGLYLGTLIVQVVPITPSATIGISLVWHLYICEISPPSQRGPLTAGPQLMTAFGLMVGFFLCYATANIESSLAWRTPFIILTLFSIAFALASTLWLVPSPRWLILRGRQSEVSAAWDVLGVGHTDRQKAEDVLQATVVRVHSFIECPDSPHQQDDSLTPLPNSTTKSSFFDVFARGVRLRTALAVFLLGMQQLSGIDGVLYYAPLFFARAGLDSSEASLLASAISAIVIFIITIPALVYSDRWGRRHSTIYGGFGISLTMFLIGGLYAGNAVHNSGAGRWIVIISIYLFVATFSVSWAIGIRIYVAESQPQHTRASATSLAYGSNWLANFLVALTTPILLAKSSYGVFFLFAGCTLLTSIVCCIFMPETKGKSLEEIEEAFLQKTSTKGNSKVLGRISASFAA